MAECRMMDLIMGKKTPTDYYRTLKTKKETWNMEEEPE